jgi:hypothetical protein
MRVSRTVYHHLRKLIVLRYLSKKGLSRLPSLEQPHRSPSSPGEVDGEYGVYHDRYQEEQPNVAMVFIEFEVCLIVHEAAREMESRHAAAGKKDEYAQYDIGYAESQDDAQGSRRVKKCIHGAPRSNYLQGISALKVDLCRPAGHVLYGELRVAAVGPDDFV